MRLLPIAAVATALVLAPAVFAQQGAKTAPANKADCEKAKMKWDEKGGKDGKGACISAGAAKK